MLEAIEDHHIDVDPLPSPNELSAALPASPAARRTVVATRDAIRRVLHGRDRRRRVAIVGPCSIHDPDSAVEYAQRLRRVAESTAESLVVVMRTYFEKPRTALGWKGLLNDPHLDGRCDVAAGLATARQLLVDINALGVGCASELLDPATPPFISDLLSWGGIGARTSESPIHRQLASGLAMPVGFKNGTDGGLDVAVNGMVAAAAPHRFAGMTRDGRSGLIRTPGNPDTHVVLRGGRSEPNFDSVWVERAAQLIAAPRAARPVLVDCSHDNSGKDHTRQGPVCRSVAGQIRAGSSAILGVMLESQLEPGRQGWQTGALLRPGVSITDACIGWNETEDLLSGLADAVKLAGDGY